MIKKLTAAIISCSLLFVAYAFCVSADTIAGVSDGQSIAIEANDKQYMIVNGYDKDGALKCSVPVKAENGYFILPADLAQYSKLRAGFLDGKEFCTIEITEREIPTSEPTPSPTASPLPSPTPTAKPVQTKRPLKSGYEREVDAMNAFAVVREVSTVANEDDEECYRVYILYQGYEMAVDIKKSITITSASDAFSYMNGCDAGALQEGDTIFFTATLSGEINSLSFIMRAVTPDILTDGSDYGESFEKLFSDAGKVAGNVSWDVMKYNENSKGGKYQFAFGVISQKSGRSLTLLGPDGNQDNEMSIGFNDDVPIYVCDVSNDNAVTLNNASSIIKSNLSTKTTIVSYDNKSKINYALVRLVNGTASDIVIYKNK